MEIWDFSLIDSARDNTESLRKKIEEEAAKLTQHTKGKVCAEFAVIYRYRTLTAVSEALSEITKPVESTAYPHSNDLQDASSLYQVLNYGFEIHNDVYKYRLFEIRIAPDYPIEMWIDSDIFRDEINEFREMDLVEIQENRNMIVVSNEADFLVCFRLIVNNRKVVHIISRMMSTND